jgi:hypothetical protein
MTNEIQHRNEAVVFIQRSVSGLETKLAGAVKSNEDVGGKAMQLFSNARNLVAACSANVA